MNRQDWQQLEQAARLLQLGDSATLAEIRRAYHQLCRRCHPDAAAGAAEGRINGPEDPDRIYRVTEAYSLLRRYCDTFRFPLKMPGSVSSRSYDPQAWWQA